MTFVCGDWKLLSLNVVCKFFLLKCRFDLSSYLYLRFCFVLWGITFFLAGRGKKWK
jgi:type IV secretory pathway TrbL component